MGKDFWNSSKKNVLFYLLTCHFDLKWERGETFSVAITISIILLSWNLTLFQTVTKLNKYRMPLIAKRANPTLKTK